MNGRHAWMGLSLHHLLAPAKLALMRDIRGILAMDGHFLIYENTSPNGEIVRAGCGDGMSRRRLVRLSEDEGTR